MFVYFPNEFDARLIQQWSDSFAKVLFVHPIDFRGYFKWDTGGSCDLNGGFWTLLGSNATKKRKIAALRTQG